MGLIPSDRSLPIMDRISLRLLLDGSIQALLPSTKSPQLSHLITTNGQLCGPTSYS
jgi:hypothetical protein